MPSLYLTRSGMTFVEPMKLGVYQMCQAAVELPATTDQIAPTFSW